MCLCTPSIKYITRKWNTGSLIVHILYFSRKCQLTYTSIICGVHVPFFHLVVFSYWFFKFKKKQFDYQLFLGSVWEISFPSPWFSFHSPDSDKQEFLVSLIFFIMPSSMYCKKYFCILSSTLRYFLNYLIEVLLFSLSHLDLKLI